MKLYKIIQKHLYNNINNEPYSLTRRNEIILLILIIIFGTFFRLYKIDHQSLWYDEAYTNFVATKIPIYDLWSNVYDVHPSLYYSLIKLPLIFGNNEFLLRVESAIFGVISIFLIYVIGRKFISPMCGIVAAVVLATNPLHIEYSQEARSYILLFLEISFTTYAYFGLTKSLLASGKISIKFALFYFLGSLAALYTHNIAIYYIFIFNLISIILFFPLRKFNGTSFLIWLLINIILLIAYLPWLIAVSKIASNFSWLEQVSIGEALSTLGGLYGFGYIFKLQPFLSLFSFFIVLIGIWLLFLRKYYIIGICIISFVLLVPFLMWITGLIKPIFMLRTVLAGLLASTLAIGTVIAFIRNRYIGLIVISIVLALNIKSIFSYYEIGKKEEWKPLSTDLRNKVTKEDAILLCPHYVYLPFRYYFNDSHNSFGWMQSKTLVELNDETFFSFGKKPLLERASYSSDDIQKYLSKNWEQIEKIDDLKTFPRVWLVVSAHCKKEYWSRLSNLDDEISKAGWCQLEEKKYYNIRLTLYGTVNCQKTVGNVEKP